MISHDLSSRIEDIYKITINVLISVLKFKTFFATICLRKKHFSYYINSVAYIFALKLFNVMLVELELCHGLREPRAQRIKACIWVK